MRRPALHVGIARSRRALGDDAGGEQALRLALELDAEDPEALSDLGALYIDTGRALEAIPLLERASRHTRYRAKTRRQLAKALRAGGEAEKALELLMDDSVTATADTLRDIAAIHEERGELPLAERQLAAAVALEPEEPGLRADLARVLEAQGDSDGAKREREMVALLDGTSGNDGAGVRQARGHLSLDDLVMSFVAQTPNAEDRVVAHLDVREPSDWKSLIVRGLRPRSPDLDAIRGALDRALGARFPLLPINASEHQALKPRIDQIFAFGEQSALDADTIATVNQVLATDAIFATRLVAPPYLKSGDDVCGGDGGFSLEVRMLSGREPDLAAVLMNVDCVEGGFETYGAWNIPALVLYGALGLFFLWPVVRGWGTVGVSIRLPDKTRGYFSIHITTKPDQVKRELVDRNSDKKKTRAKGRLDFLKRFERHMAGRHTTFRWIPARKFDYTITVGGPLLEARGDEIIGHFLEEQKLRVRRGQTTQIDFDFRPKECAVEVRVELDRQPLAGARIAIKGDPASLRYARDGNAFLYLGTGEYTILIGSEDAVAEYPIEILSLENSIPLQVDLGDDASVVFRDCSQAVDAYLQNDLRATADALEAAGQVTPAHRIRAMLYQQLGRAEDASRELEAAGEFEGAAILSAMGADHEGTASLFEQGGDHARAAESYRSAGQFADAARCFESVYDYQNALECWREVGDVERELTLLEKLGEFMDAGQLAREIGDAERAITNLQQIDGRHVSYGDACRAIAEIVSERGDHDLAVSKFEEALSTTGVENASIDILESYAAVLERAGKRQEALSAYEAVRRRDAKRDDLAERITELRRAIEADARGAASDPFAGRTQAVESRYELLEEVGRGGMGVVFKARDRRLGRIVALKQLPPNLRDHPTAVELFEREARAAAALDHMNIVTLFDAGEENGSYFITMELLEGRPLNVILQRSGRVSVRDSARLGIQICAGLHYAHERRIVHRDIKTANLFFTNEQIVKIMDFGIAKSLEEVRRSTTVIGGTPYYMAPEQAAGEPVDHRADLYALGVTLYQLVTGDLPFRDGDVTYRHRHEAPPDPREFDVGVPEALAEVILKLMAKLPEDRFSSAAEAARELQAALGNGRS